ncbi:MAG: MarR family transcriptional regulator [Terriglobia bacterium]|nr:MarR family transcriptional regulator [Terriglobia bacterium]
MKTGRKRDHRLIEEIVGRLAGRHSTAVVLFHQAVAERLGLGPTDHKCLDLLRERGGIASGETITASKLAAITGLTTGAMTGVVARLERAGFLRREPDAHDQRRQLLYPDMERTQEIHNVFAPIRKDVAGLLQGFDTHQLTAIAQFLAQSTEFAYRHTALLRAQDTLAPADNRSGNTGKESFPGTNAKEQTRNGRRFPGKRSDPRS